MLKPWNQIAAFLDVPRFETYPDNAVIQPNVRHFGSQKIEVLPPDNEDLLYLHDLSSQDIAATGVLTGLDISCWFRS
ncbi:MAG: hypothetical protein GY788_11365 [bacterium]|nr:hypothetical protein [bacterium]